MTHIPYGSDQAVKLESIALFAATMQRNTTIGRMVGEFPKQKSAENKLRNQTSSDYPIVRCRDLQKTAGDEVTFDLVNPLNGKPMMGSKYAEGRGEAMTFAQDALRINQTRKPINSGDTMTQQRTPHQIRALCRAQGYGYMARLEDQLNLVHMAGARGFHDNVEWVVPLASDVDFNAICINPIKAPTGNRHFISTGTGIETVKAAGDEIAVAAQDLMNLDVMDALRAHLDGMALPPAPCKFKGDKMAADSPIRVLLVSPLQYNSIIKSGNFRTLQATAMARASQAANNPLFMGEAGLWNGILVVKMPKPIRFFAGDPIHWCADITSRPRLPPTWFPQLSARTSRWTGPCCWGPNRSGETLWQAPQVGRPYFWSEKELDHGDQLEVLVGMINGKSKIRFDIDIGQASSRQTTASSQSIPLLPSPADHKATPRCDNLRCCGTNS